MSGPRPSPFASKQSAGASPAMVATQLHGMNIQPPSSMVNAVVNRPSSPLASPMAQSQSKNLAANAMPFKDQDIESLGSDVQQATMGVVKKITEKMTLANFGDLGEMLANVQLEADRLDPAAQTSGLTGWIKAKVFDVRKTMLKQLTTASQTFDKLAEKMASHVAIHETWVNDLETLYTENFEQYKRILDVIKRGEAWEASAIQALNNMPMVDPNDPEAPMKVQIRRDAEAMLNRLRQRIDNFRRLKVLTECNGPRIRSQQESSRTAARTLRDYSEQMIPIIQMEFAMFMQSQDVKKSGQITTNARNLAETSLKRSADSAKDSMIDAANQANTAMISNDTMTHMRARLLEAVTTVKSIETNAQQRRVDDASMMNQQQTEYLNQLQSNGAPI